MPSAFVLLFTTPLLALFLRLILGAILFYYGLYKLHDRRSFNRTLTTLVVNERIRALVVIGVPLVETTLGGLLLFNIVPAFVTGCIEALLLLFSAVLLYGWKTKKMDECGCGRTSLPPWSALVRNGLLLLIGGGLLWHPDTTVFLSSIMLIEGALLLLIILATIRSSSQNDQLSQQQGSPLTARRALLARGAAAFGAAVLLPLLNPTTSLAFVCSCSCDGGGYYTFGDCVCGVMEVFYVEVTLCCYINTVCDEWVLGVGLADC